ncbi:MAG TPA: glycosyltransferase family 2 protein, partial [Longimicrobiales bacterium]|nr:glycosyltransferase family 2 protein [Longimicrobiales bacterium]
MSALGLAAAGLLGGMLLTAIWNLATAPRLERAPPPRRKPLVSVLVPARNEAANLDRCVARLRELDWPRLEILVLDDGSTDGTAAIALAHQRVDPRVRVLHGRSPPDGWLGKPWACHQLARAARGEVLAFCDADVSAAPSAVRRTLGALEAADAGALTCLPRQRTRHQGVAAAVPLVTQLPILSLLPLSLVPGATSPSLTTGNGQWFALTRTAYGACGGHAAVRDQVVEDVALARRVKASGQRLTVVVSTRLLQAAAYRDVAGLRAGFGKNLYALAGGRPGPFALALVVYLLTMVYPLMALVGVAAALPSLMLLLAVRLCGALLFRHPPH